MPFYKKAMLLALILSLMLALCITRVRQTYEVESGKWRVDGGRGLIPARSQ